MATYVSSLGMLLIMIMMMIKYVLVGHITLVTLLVFRITRHVRVAPECNTIIQLLIDV